MRGGRFLQWASVLLGTTVTSALGAATSTPLSAAAVEASHDVNGAFILASDPTVRPDECDHDEDGNGIADGFEDQLARRLVPALHFDATETARSPLEPVTLYHALRIAPDRIRVRFAFLFARDDGFVDDDKSLCSRADSTRHPGDSEIAIVDVRITPWPWGSRTSWRARVLQVEANGETRFVDRAPRIEAWDAAHIRPTLYPSAGKHHLYFRGGMQAYPCVLLGRWSDPARGDGARLIPDVAHVPPFFRDPAGMLHASAPLTRDRRRWWNGCLAARFPDDPTRWREATTSLRPNVLAEFGGEEVEGTCFRGGLGGRCGVAEAVWRVMSASPSERVGSKEGSPVPIAPEVSRFQSGVDPDVPSIAASEVLRALIDELKSQRAAFDGFVNPEWMVSVWLPTKG